MHERLGIAGSGAIACGLAATAARHGEVVLWARSDSSAHRARGSVLHICGRLSGEVNAGHVRVETDLDALGEATAIVEAVAEDEAIKAGVLADLGRVARGDAILATTTSSLSLERLALATGAPERFVGEVKPVLMPGLARVTGQLREPDQLDEVRHTSGRGRSG